LLDVTKKDVSGANSDTIYASEYADKFIKAVNISSRNILNVIKCL
jgi:hypothetical protein